MALTGKRKLIFIVVAAALLLLVADFVHTQVGKMAKAEREKHPIITKLDEDDANYLDVSHYEDEAMFFDVNLPNIVYVAVRHDGELSIDSVSLEGDTLVCHGSGTPSLTGGKSTTYMIELYNVDSMKAKDVKDAVFENRQSERTEATHLVGWVGHWTGLPN